MTLTRPKISAVILAGGQGQRMGGSDKGLLVVKGKPLVAWLIERIQPQVDEIFISANRHHEQYAGFGYPILRDTLTGFAGPLAGLSTALRAATHPLILCVPCDTPLLPANLAERLYAGLIIGNRPIAVAQTGSQIHHTTMLCRRELAAHLENFLASGDRKVAHWQAQLQASVVDFYETDAFTNINTPAEMDLLEQKLS